jgi:hypothetical protein
MRASAWLRALDADVCDTSGESCKIAARPRGSSKPRVATPGARGFHEGLLLGPRVRSLRAPSLGSSLQAISQLLALTTVDL